MNFQKQKISRKEKRQRTENKVEVTEERRKSKRRKGSDE